MLALALTAALSGSAATPPVRTVEWAALSEKSQLPDAAPHGRVKVHAGTVSNPAELWKALEKAKPGDTIVLAPGHYAKVTLRDFKFDGMVTITGPGAVLSDLSVQISKGITFRDIELYAEYARGSDPIKIQSSEDIHFDNINVHGSLDDDPQNDTSAMLVRNSSKITITNSEFQELANAVTHLDCDNIEFSKNYFHKIRMDGIRGGGSSNLIITNNFFTDFRPLPADHPDAIQVWNSNTKTPAQNITITENVILRGNGGAPQGIFVTTQISRLRYRNVNVINNIVIGSLYHGITVSGADDARIENNRVITYADIGARISVNKSTGVSLTNNAAPTYLTDKDVAFTAKAANTKTRVPRDGGMAELRTWLGSRTDAPKELMALIK